MGVAEIPAQFDFDEIARAIMGMEAGGYVFQRNAIKVGANGQFNEASFDFHPDGLFPADCLVQSAGEAGPAGCSEAWRGPMLVQDQVRQVVLYRRAA